MTIKYTKDHEWIKIDGDIGTVGITDHAQGALGDIVFVELPAMGKAITMGGDAAVVESVKAASDVYAPVTGEIVAVNSDLEASPATINDDAQGAGWFFKVKLANPSELDGMMDEAAYKAYLATL